MAEPSQQPIEQLFSCLSHELRTPITSLQGAIALLQTHQVQDESEIESLLNIASESAERLTQIIENILDWHEITRKDGRLFKQPCNIAFLLLRVIDSLQPFALSKKIQVYLETPTWVTINADHHFLPRALSHLLHNAIKFSPPDRPIRLIADIHENIHTSVVPQLQITIQDQGIGIPANALKDIFHPFHQVNSSDSRSHGGLGLELAICYEVIRQHQGKIWAESELEKGTAFHIVLPIHQIGDAADPGIFL